jgi:hypothetical protein
VTLLSNWVRLRDTVYFPSTIRENQWNGRFHPTASCPCCGFEPEYWNDENPGMLCDIELHDGERGWDDAERKEEVR